MKIASNIAIELNNLANPEKAKILQRYFKTGKGEYGEGDIFLGIVVPKQRKIAKKFSNSSLSDLKILLKSKIHEYRFTALEILVLKYEFTKNEKEKEKIVNFYLKNTKFINNWDLVDTSARYILGDYLFNKKRNIIYDLARSQNLWERRISIISTHFFIVNGQYEDTFKICELLLHDKQDLIQKACGWMLREIGKYISRDVEKVFIDKNVKSMSRITLSYALEHFSTQEKLFYRKIRKN